MILARQVFQVKYGHMDEILSALKEFSERAQNSGGVSRILTDLSGQNFTLVFETKAESMDAFWEGLQASFKDPEMAAMTGTFMQYIESGHREFYTIEYEAGS
jgi:hypothetical protein